MSAAVEKTDEEALAEALAALAAAAANIPAPEEESDGAKRTRLELAESTAQAALDAELKRGIWETTHQARKLWKLAAEELERFEQQQDEFAAARAMVRERLAKIDADAARSSATTNTVPPTEVVSVLPYAIPEALHLCTDQANAQRLQRMYGTALISVSGNFYAWNGKRWQLDDGLAQRFACDLSRIIAHERAEYRRQLREIGANAAQGVGDQIVALTDLVKELTAWGAKCEMKSTQDAALGMLKKLLNVPVDMIDADPWSLNVENGTIDLRTGTLRPHAAADLITKLAPVAYNPAAQCPRFKRFLSEIFQGNQAVVEFLQRWYGYAATGDTSEQALLIKFGPGGNGKSTLGDVLDGVLGEYSTPATLGLLTSKSSSDTAHHAEIADLRGARLVSASETEDGAKLKEALLKQLTGGDKLKGKRLYGQLFSFKPSHKLELLTNHKPIIKGSDFSIWRRIMLLNFPVKYGSAEECRVGKRWSSKTSRWPQRCVRRWPVFWRGWWRAPVYGTRTASSHHARCSTRAPTIGRSKTTWPNF
jgi:P4 family phage/plasmid primase-like protien